MPMTPLLIDAVPSQGVKPRPHEDRTVESRTTDFKKGIVDFKLAVLGNFNSY